MPFADIKPLCIMDAGNQGMIIVLDRVFKPRRYEITDPAVPGRTGPSSPSRSTTWRGSSTGWCTCPEGPGSSGHPPSGSGDGKTPRRESPPRLAWQTVPVGLGAVVGFIRRRTRRRTPDHCELSPQERPWNCSALRHSPTRASCLSKIWRGAHRCSTSSLSEALRSSGRRPWRMDRPREPRHVPAPRRRGSAKRHVVWTDGFRQYVSFPVNRCYSEHMLITHTPASRVPDGDKGEIMPGMDGSGPMGYGPMTGGRRGSCVGATADIGFGTNAAGGAPAWVAAGAAEAAVAAISSTPPDSPLAACRAGRLAGAGMRLAGPVRTLGEQAGGDRRAPRPPRGGAEVRRGRDRGGGTSSSRETASGSAAVTVPGAARLPRPAAGAASERREAPLPPRPHRARALPPRPRPSLPVRAPWRWSPSPTGAPCAAPASTPAPVAR